MILEIRLPSSEILSLETEAEDVVALKTELENALGAPAACQDLRVDGRPLTRIDEADGATVDLVLRVGPDYAIAALEVPDIRRVETFRPAGSIVQRRDFERFAHTSDRIRFTDRRPLAKIRDLSKAEARAEEKLGPYREHAEVRRERIRALCGELGSNEIVAMSFNAPYSLLFRNWHASCVANGIDVRHQTLLFPMDPEADRIGSELGYRTYYDPESYGGFGRSAEVRFGDHQWIDCLFMKNAAMGDLLACGLDVLFQDVDIVWKKNPLPLLRNQGATGEWDFMFHKAAIHGKFQPLYYNSGFVYARSNEFSRLTWDKIVDYQRYVYAYGSQQAPVNTVMNTYRERGLRTRALDPDEFVNGHLLRRHPKRGETKLFADAYILHANWTSGLEQKLDRLRKIGFWHLDDRENARPDDADRLPTRETPHGDHAQCVVSDQLGCIFIAIAKNASSTIRAMLGDFDDRVYNSRCARIPRETWQRYKVFAFLRDPVDRVLAAYHEVSSRLTRGVGQPMPFQHLPDDPDRFEAFLDAVETKPWEEHVRPQADLIGEHTVDFWGHFDSLEIDVARLCKQLGQVAPLELPQFRQRGPQGPFLVRRKELPIRTLDRIRRIYRRDFELIQSVAALRGNAGERNRAEAIAKGHWNAPEIRPKSVSS